MTEAERASEQPESAVGRSAGALLREARQAQGVHIAVLAASIKVSQRKLEALEADRYDELPDATFTRALAKTVCRSLKIDPEPVLALLPQHQVDDRLAHVSQGINARFRDSSRGRDSAEGSAFSSPAVWGPTLLIVAAVVVYFWPQGWMLGSGDDAAATPTTVVIAAPDTEAAPASEPAEVSPAAPAPAVTDAPPAVPSGAEATDAAPATAAASQAPPPAEAAQTPSANATDGSALTVRANAASWVEVIDARSTVLVSRLLKAGESLTLDGAAPFKVRVGNAADTELVFRGQPVDLAPATRDNVARLELK